MTISHTPDLFEEIQTGKPIPLGKLAYFRTRLRLELYDFILRRFHAQENLTKAELARRIHRSPDVVNRWLGAPGNWTIDTLSDLMIGMGRFFVSFDDDSVVRALGHVAEQNTTSERPPSSVSEAVSPRPNQPAVQPIQPSRSSMAVSLLGSSENGR
jgi:hypothetical protein